MTDFDNFTPTQDERVMAGLAHVAALWPMMGLIGAVIIWVTQKDKSRYVAFQSLQSVFYQLAMFAAMFIGMGCYMCTFFANFITLPLSSALQMSESEAVMPLFAVLAMFSVFVPFMVFLGIFFVGFLFMAYAVVAAIMAFQGKPFRYVLIGRRVEKFMQS